MVIGSLSLGQLLRFSQEPVLEALAEGKTVLLYTPGLPQSPKNRTLAADLATSRRQLKNWGVVFTDGAQKRLITAREAQQLRDAGAGAARHLGKRSAGADAAVRLYEDGAPDGE